MTDCRTQLAGAARQVVADRGVVVLSSRNVLRSLLTDLGDGHSCAAEIDVLVGVATGGVVAFAQGHPDRDGFDGFVARVAQSVGYPADSVRWASTAWFDALGVPVPADPSQATGPSPATPDPVGPYGGENQDGGRRQAGAWIGLGVFVGVLAVVVGVVLVATRQPDPGPHQGNENGSGVSTSSSSSSTSSSSSSSTSSSSTSSSSTSSSSSTTTSSSTSLPTQAQAASDFTGSYTPFASDVACNLDSGCGSSYQNKTWKLDEHQLTPKLTVGAAGDVLTKAAISECTGALTLPSTPVECYTGKITSPTASLYCTNTPVETWWYVAILTQQIEGVRRTMTGKVRLYPKDVCPGGTVRGEVTYDVNMLESTAGSGDAGPSGGGE